MALLPTVLVLSPYTSCFTGEKGPSWERQRKRYQNLTEGKSRIYTGHHSITIYVHMDGTGGIWAAVGVNLGVCWASGLLLVPGCPWLNSAR